MNIINKIKKRGFIKSAVFLMGHIIYLPIRTIAKLLFKICKVKNDYILFSSDPDFSDNAKSLYDYYKTRTEYKNYTFIWLVSDAKKYKDIKNNKTLFITVCSNYHKYQTIKAMYYLSISKIIYFTHSSHFEYMQKKKEQMLINLWHGCGYKDIQKSKNRYIDIHPFDYALVPGKVFIETKSKFWGCSKENILDIGYPRYDLLFNKNEKGNNYSKGLRKTSNKLILWMPTFRKTGNNTYPEETITKNFDLPILNSEKELIELNDICKNKKITLCIKRHPRQMRYMSENLNLSNIIFISNNDLVKENVELYSLLSYSDGLITDYSSVAIDYMLLDKPIAFSLDDFEKYKNSRGFVFEDPLKYMPGHHVYNFDDLKQFIVDISNNKDVYKEDRHNIMNEVHNPCDNYCKRIVDTINELYEKKNNK